MRFFCIIVFLGICTTLQATEYLPWYPRNLELQLKATNQYLGYHTLDTVHGFKKRRSNDYFLFLSLLGAYKVYSIELETSLAATRHRSFSFNDIRLTGRYQWLDDVVGDPVSLNTGITLTQTFKLARHDLSCFYRGGIQLELFCAVGKEISSGQFWCSRLWGTLGFGIADIGAPWIFFRTSYDHNFWDIHMARIFLNTLWGFGPNGLHLEHHFKGWRSIHYQAIDIGTEYHYTVPCGLDISLGFAHRVYALNAPRAVNFFSLSLLYPFGI
jgi:hypothetical protein